MSKFNYVFRSDNWLIRAVEFEFNSDSTNPYTGVDELAFKELEKVVGSRLGWMIYSATKDGLTWD